MSDSHNVKSRSLNNFYGLADLSHEADECRICDDCIGYSGNYRVRANHLAASNTSCIIHLAAREYTGGFTR
jgi:hypothetical protein